jgi:prepilin-type N-terminal cleavage/methylation domain-containing protein
VRHQTSFVRSSARAGFTFIEILIVIVVMGLVYSIVSKPLARSFGASARRAATREVTAYLFRARAIAVQQSRRANLVRSGNTLKIMVDSSGTPRQVGTTINVSLGYSATLTATPTDTISFDPRGFALVGVQVPKLIITRGTQADTLCVSGLGRIATRSC